MENKLVSIVCLWDGGELLPFLIESHKKLVDQIVVVYSNKSNFGNWIDHSFKNHDNVKYVHWEPKPGLQAHVNEANKRNFGLKVAINEGATHILMQDVDEFYLSNEFNEEKERIYSNDINGLVCKLHCYFKSPELWVNDHTLVTFIQKVTPGLQFGSFKGYPYAYDASGNAHIDPTRRPNQFRKIEWANIICHHYSWIRKDIQRKIYNSSASANLLKSSIYMDLENAKEGAYNEFYRDTIKSAPNYFNIKI